MHDPVRPVLKQPAYLGWEGKFRKIDLTVERPFRGEELLSRMKGWFTVDVMEVIEIVNRYGRLKLLDDYHLVVETEGKEELEALAADLTRVFGKEVELEYLPKGS